jgi:annexin A7/11
MESALLQQVRCGTDRVMCNAMLLEAAMAGMGTKDHLLINRVVRFHWDKAHMQQVKAAYKHRYHKDLANTIRAEISGSYEMLMLALI